MAEHRDALFIQWKGLCCDFNCPKCGSHGHRCDLLFMYHLKCSGCGTLFKVSDHVPVTEMTPEEVKELESRSGPSYVPWKMSDQETEEEVRG